MADGFVVGDFKAAAAPEPRKKKSVDKVPAAETAAEGSPKSARQLYLERLAEAGISEAEANSVFDDVLTKGYYQETTTIRGRRLVLRTRRYEDHVRTLGAVEVQNPRFQTTQEELQARYNLAASLVEWNNVSYKKGGDSDAEFLAALDAVRALPTPVYSMLVAALVKFDAKIFLVFSEGAAESF